MPKAKAKALSKAQLHNVIKISIGDRKRKRKTRRRPRRTRQDDKIDLLMTLASKPQMREIKQDAPQNNLITSSIISTNAEIVKALNDIAKPSFNTGYAPPPFPTAPEANLYTAPPEENKPKARESVASSYAGAEPKAPRSTRKHPFFSLSPLMLSPTFYGESDEESIYNPTMITTPAYRSETGDALNTKNNDRFLQLMDTKKSPLRRLATEVLGKNAKDEKGNYKKKDELARLIMLQEQQGGGGGGAGFKKLF
jgi:hypothetical protein